MDGILLLKKLKANKIKDNTTIVVTTPTKQYEMLYQNKQVTWEPDTFKFQHLFDDNVTFNVKETQTDEVLDMLFPVGTMLEDSHQTQLIVNSIGKWDKQTVFQGDKYLQWSAQKRKWVLQNESYTISYYIRVS